MPEERCETDVLAWSWILADLLRRIGQGDAVDGVDWANIAEEIEGVGLSKLHAVEIYLNLILVHLLRLPMRPESTGNGHWRGEIVRFQSQREAALLAVDGE